MLEKIILGFLKTREMTAYDVKKTMELSINYFYSSSLGSINPALKKLEKNQEVTCRETVEKSRVKKFYKITSLGEESYASWLNEPIKIGRIKEDSLVRLFFLSDANSSSRKKLLKEYVEELENAKNEFLILKNRFTDTEIPKELAEKAKFQLATLQFGIDYFDFTHKWFSEFSKQL
jgi:DNA-binding PadR family transcriptional regulator